MRALESLALAAVALCLVLGTSVADARADLRLLAPWSCPDAEVTDDDREVYFEELRSSAYTLLDESALVLDARLDVYGDGGEGGTEGATGPLTVDPATGALMLGDEDFTGIVRADLRALRGASLAAAHEASLIEDLEGHLRAAGAAQQRIWDTRQWAAGTAGRVRELAERDILQALASVGHLGFMYVGERDGRLVNVLAYEHNQRLRERGELSGDPAAIAAVDREGAHYLIHEADLDAFLDCGRSREDVATNRLAQVVDLVELELVAARQRHLATQWPINEAPAGPRERPLEDQIFDLDDATPEGLLAFATLLRGALAHTRANVEQTRARIAAMDVDDAHVLAASTGVAEHAYRTDLDDVACVVRSEIHIGWRTLLRAGAVVAGIAATFVNPVLGVALASAATAASVAESALLFRDARRARTEWHTGYDSSTLHADAVHRQAYAEAWAALGFSFLDGLVTLQQLRLFSSALARAPPAVQADELAAVAASRGDSVAVAARVSRGRRAGLPCGAKFDDAGPACVPVPAHAIGNLGDGHRAHNTQVLDQYEPGSTTAFSGVYHVDADRVLIRPSGTTPLRTGAMAPGAVDRYGGHGVLAQELGELTGVAVGRNIGFVAFYDEAGKVSVSWRSRSVNQLNWGDVAAPVEHQQPAMDAIADALGVLVTSR